MNRQNKGCISRPFLPLQKVMKLWLKILLTIAMVFFMAVFVIAAFVFVMFFIFSDLEWNGISYFIAISFLLINLILSLLSRYFLLKFRLMHTDN